jgi:integration host factor subunit alpha
MSQASELTDQRLRVAGTDVGRTPKTTVTRVDLIEAVYRTVGLSRAESAWLVEEVIKAITECLERGETVKLSSFGSFAVRTKGPRMGRNPKTGAEVPIAHRRVLMFKASDVLRKRVQQR